ncbi:MAG TPA: hypothetical protein VGD01_06415 [Candidatus Elarobacter sp.]|jgi:hypothetical protein
MERRDLYQDDLTEERYPSPARREDEAGKQTLDPDASADDDDAVKTIPRDGAAKTALGYPHGVPGGVHGDPETGGDDDDDEDDEDDEEDDV